MRDTIGSLANFLVDAGRLRPVGRARRYPRVAGTRSAELPGQGVRGYVIRVLLSWELAVQIQIQLKHVDSRLSEEAQLARQSVLLNELLYLVFGNSTLAGNSRNLKLGRSGRNIGIESGSRSCDQVNRHGAARIIHLVARYICLHPVDQVLISGAEL